MLGPRHLSRMEVQRRLILTKLQEEFSFPHASTPVDDELSASALPSLLKQLQLRLTVDELHFLLSSIILFSRVMGHWRLSVMPLGRKALRTPLPNA